MRIVTVIGSMIESVSFGVNKVCEEVIPVAIFDNSSLRQDRLSAVDGPSHAGLLHAIFDEGSASAFDHTGCNGISFLEVDIVAHHMSVVIEVGDGFRERFLLRLGELILVFSQPLAESADERTHLSVE